MQTLNVLLDTHVWIWLMNGDKQLSVKSLEVIEKAITDGGVFVSAISAWEIGMLEKKKRIILSKPSIEWIKSSLHVGIQIAPITPEIAIDSCHLSHAELTDPADRMIVATARVEGLILLTSNKRIIDYGKKKSVLVMRADK